MMMKINPQDSLDKVSDFRFNPRSASIDPRTQMVTSWLTALGNLFYLDRAIANGELERRAAVAGPRSH